MAPHSGTLAWKIPWTEEPGRLPSIGFRRVRHDWATSLSRIGEGNGNPAAAAGLPGNRLWDEVCRLEVSLGRTLRRLPIKHWGKQEGAETELGKWCGCNGGLSQSNPVYLGKLITGHIFLFKLIIWEVQELSFLTIVSLISVHDNISFV